MPETNDRVKVLALVMRVLGVPLLVAVAAVLIFLHPRRIAPSRE